MKNHVSPPALVSAMLVPFDNEYVSPQKSESTWRTEFPSKIGRRRTVTQIDRLLLARNLQDGETGGGGPAINQQIETAIDPFSGLGAGDVRLVLNIGLHHLDGPAQQAAAKILDREVDGDLSTRTANIPVRSGNIAQQADPHRCGRCSQHAGTRQRRGRRRADHPATCDRSGCFHCPRSLNPHLAIAERRPLLLSR